VVESTACMARETRAAGASLFALLLAIVAGCAGQAPSAAPVVPPPATTPAPAGSPAGSWAQALTFSGDVQGGMGHVLPDSAATRSECSGRNSRPEGAWASALYGAVGQDVYEVLVIVHAYRGPGAYGVPDVTVQVARPDGSSVWQTSAGDQATFTVDPGEESGTVSATLTNLSNTATRLRVDGRWSCRT
jgi:hypothetical protein